MASKIPQEVMSEFIAECDEIIQRVTSNLSKIEKGDDSKSVIDEIYRDMHTMKGSSQLFGIHPIGDVAHAMETSIDPLRNGNFKLEGKFFDAIFRSLDVIESTVSGMKSDGDFDRFKEDALKAVSGLIDAATVQFGAKEAVPMRDPIGVEESFELPVGVDSSSETHVENSKMDVSEINALPKSTPNAPSSESINATQEEKTSATAASPTVETNSPSAESKTPEASKKPAGTPVDSSVRVQVELLDRLMNLTGELVLVRNQLLQYSTRSEDAELIAVSQSLDIVTSDLQEEVMKTRMQPIGNVLNKYQRIVRDTSRDLGKKIELRLVGAETELDKTLLEAIKDPLTHLVRNACDHGLEGPDERLAAGKPETGTVHVKAYHEGGQVIVEIEDDGRGLARDKILAKALEKNVVTPEQGERLSDRDVYNLIFAPGFSTAEKVSAISGRGVGMDVVKTNIEKIGGNIDLNSRPGNGTTICLKIPLTLAIVPALIVRSGGERFAIPQVKLVELVRVEPDDSSQDRVEYLQGKPVYRLRGDLLPLVSIDDVMSGKTESIEKMDDDVNIVVLNADGDYFGLVVDEILDTADIVVKPISQFLKSIQIFSGATIMGNGSVALILDIAGISRKAMAQSSLETESRNQIRGRDGSTSTEGDAQEFLVFQLSSTSKFAVPLCLVNRLEEFDPSQIEFSGDQKVVQYRDSVLPIISMSQSLGFEGEASTENEEAIPVIVAQKQNRRFGFKVKSILDVVTIDGVIDEAVKDRDGVMGNVIHHDEVIVVVDILDLMDSLIRKMSGASAHETSPTVKISPSSPLSGQGRKILFADDAAFFRKQVSKILQSAGYQVMVVKNGQEAADELARQSSGTYDLLLSDIEMPKMDGHQLAQYVRADEKWKNLPIIAISTRFAQRDLEKGQKSGFSVYLEKLDPDKLLEAIHRLLPETGSQAS